MNFPAPIPRDDPRRLAALRSLDMGGNAPDPFFDALAGTAAALCEAPIAHVILVDERRQWFVGSVGIPDIRDLSGQCTFSTHLVTTGRTLVVPDASLDARFAGHPLVTGPHNMQFYAGAPIRFGRDITLGALCVVDHTPRELALHQILALRRLAGVASRAFDSRATTLRSVAEFRHRATHDVLTGLPNRAAFESALADVLSRDPARGTPAPAMLYLDLDGFRSVNDTCGHAAGDQLLRQIGGIVSTCIGDGDLVARLGADEFGVLLAQGDGQRAIDVAQRICDQLEDFRFVYQARRFRIGASIGLVSLQTRWSGVTALMQAADASCHAAKEAGRNRVHVWQRSDTALATRQNELQWISRIELALDEDRFVLHGQRIDPIGADADGLHVEVLLRMREADGTLTMPGKFMPVAERFHLATQVDRWVIRQAFDWMTQAARGGVAIDLMTVNLSGQTLGDRAFHRDLIAMVRTATFDVAKLCIEITETAVVEHLADARAFIEDVRAHGVKVALDDFGAGASSFTYLKSFAVDFLKIDGQFITRLLDDPADHAVVRCFAEVASVMGIRTIAECVEQAAVRDELRTIGIDLVQGYLIHAPEPLVALLAHAPPLDAGLHPLPRRRRVTEVPFDLPNPNCLELGNHAEMLLWADDLSISTDRLQEIVKKVGPMRAAIHGFVMAQRRAAGRPGDGPHDHD